MIVIQSSTDSRSKVAVNFFEVGILTLFTTFVYNFEVTAVRNIYNVSTQSNISSLNWVDYAYDSFSFELLSLKGRYYPNIVVISYYLLVR